MSEQSAEKDAPRKCRWFHRWGEDEWVGGMSNPSFKNVCARCGAVRVWRFY